jgi:hypothetical protein
VFTRARRSLSTASLIGSTSSTTRWSTRPDEVISTTNSRVGCMATNSTWRTVERVRVGYCTIATCRVSCASMRTVRCTTSSTSTAPSRNVEMARRSAPESGRTADSRSTKRR